MLSTPLDDHELVVQLEGDIAIHSCIFQVAFLKWGLLLEFMSPLWEVILHAHIEVGDQYVCEGRHARPHNSVHPENVLNIDMKLWWN